MTGVYFASLLSDMPFNSTPNLDEALRMLAEGFEREPAAGESDTIARLQAENAKLQAELAALRERGEPPSAIGAEQRSGADGCHRRMEA